MAETRSFLKGKHILAVDDEWDVIETIGEMLSEAEVDVAQDYETASEKILQTRYDLAVLDIMGVNGMTLLEECVKRDIPAIMLTANSMNPESLMTSIQKGAISYLSKEHLSDLDTLINDLLGARNDGKPTWKMLFEKLGDHFNLRFGKNWKEEDKDFWDDFEKDWKISRGIQERLLHKEDIINKGI
ncbi:response regulator [Desulfospira joergensenii]|uniref:response regulator n=1 Tax=Desulfospira joergensenii TaxID=53329 RepID=UPI0003B67EC4|nr:response regulator [Desulfospira joergensenii]